MLLGKIVNGADTDNTLYRQPEGPGLEAIAELNGEGGQAHPAAAETLARDIRLRLEELGAVLSL